MRFSVKIKHMKRVYDDEFVGKKFDFEMLKITSLLVLR